MNLMCRAANVLREEGQRASIGQPRDNLLILLYIGLSVAIHRHEIGIKSNRKSERFGECLLSQVIYRPSRAGRAQFVKVFI